MSRILFLCSEYGKDANGICIKNVAHSLINDGAEIWIISESSKHFEDEVADGVCVHYVPMSLYSRLDKSYEGNSTLKHLIQGIILFLRRIMAVMSFPNTAPLRSWYVKRDAEKIIQENNIDLLVCGYRPFESVWAGIRIKRKLKGQIKVVAYHLDLLLEPNTSNKILARYKKYRAKLALKSECKLLDRIIVPESSTLCESSVKVKKVGFPLFFRSNSYEKCDFLYDSTFYNVTYIGSMDQYNRNPKYFFELVEKYNEKSQKKIRIHVWGNVTPDILSIFSHYESVAYHGYIDNNYVEYLLNSADCLLNISNKITSNMIPSKIFQMFSTGKPIINILSSDTDSALKFFEAYENTINILEYENNLFADVDKIDVFVHSASDIDISVKLDEVFKRYTPAFCAETITEVLKGMNEIV